MATKATKAGGMEVKPGGGGNLTTSEQAFILRNLVGQQAVLHAYQNAYGDRALKKHVQDLKAWRSGKQPSPFQSVEHLLNPIEDR